MLKGLYSKYSEIKSDIKKRLKEFSKIKNEWNTDIIFKELCFCLLTPQSKARNAWKAIESLSDSGKLFNANHSEIAEELNIVRFKNNKARYLIALRNLFYTEKENLVISLLESDKNIFEKRKWLVTNIKGIGFKEAGHFLRNIGFYEEVTILDRHILKNLKESGIIDEIPTTLSEKRYLEIENKMKQFSTKINIPLEYLDFVLWYKETNDIFK